MTRYAVLRGHRSGRGRAGERGVAVAEALRAAGQQVHELAADTADAAREACRVAVQEGVQVLVVVGGDGAVGLAAGACRGTGTALGIVPAGTGNDNARSLGIPLRTEAAISTLLHDARRPVDLIEVAPTGRVVLGSVPTALDARIALRATTLPKWLGPTVYAAATLPELRHLRPQPYRLELDGVPWETEALVVAACNMPVYGGGMRIAPDADPTDGLLDVVVIGRVGARQALGLLTGVFAGRHVGHPSVQVRRAATVRVEGPELVVLGDGDPIGPLPVTCTTLPGAVQVVVPPGAVS
ncbi:diacylglycerol/lipid kinase family protein [Ornithinicoccus hortensis]|uniref:Diacylglycerol kinase n=1 Tax=Ornithinicoccus hortensis TaxID=82346 RepID=A0A542YSX8_9MICO|nr:diacylglycerol kinase family protein [Ornithinicoccus hortensis]TQL51205.1 diacylglycerol kinase [Ornithinicoccus hortensis]